MKHKTRLIIICLLIVLSFLTGFNYQEINPRLGVHGLLITLRDTPQSLSTALAATLTESHDSLSPIDTYSEMLSYLDSQYYGNDIPDTTLLTYGAIRGMLAELDDRYTKFLDPQEYARIREENTGNFQGIGTLLEMQDGETIVRKPFKDSPAIRAGLKANDVIQKVDGEAIHGMDIEDVVKKIRGPIGTTVVLSIRRAGIPDPFDVNIVREIITPPIVEWRMQDDENKIGYIALTQFNEKSDQQFDEALGELESKGMRGLILDLRGNRGGILDVAVDICSRFIPKGEVVRIQRDGKTDVKKVNKSKQNHKFYPLAVLINGGSASASEILAGAIQDHHMGTLVGTESFGKGLVQSIITLGDGSALAITTAKYLTPSGRDVNKTKIKPDVLVEPSDTDDENNDTQLNKAVEIVRDQLKSGHTAMTAQELAKI